MDVSEITDVKQKDFDIMSGKLVRYNGRSEDVFVPDGVRVIGRFALSQNENIKNITLPPCCREIEKAAFFECASLETAGISNVAAIGISAFEGCCKLEKVHLGKKIKTIGKYAFNGGMLNMYGQGGSVSEKYASENNIFFISDGEDVTRNENLSVASLAEKNEKTKKIQAMLNLNMLILGGSGTGKSRFFVKPNVMQCNTSYVITDPSGELIQSCGKMLERMGYDIKVFNIDDMEHSDNYNPFHYINDVNGNYDEKVRAAIPSGRTAQSFFYRRYAFL